MRPARSPVAPDQPEEIATVRIELRGSDPAIWRQVDFVAGERNAPPEDCGGIPGFYETLEAAADPTHENHAEAKQWLDDYDPDTLDELPIKYALGRIAARRKAARARLGMKPSPG